MWFEYKILIYKECFYLWINELLYCHAKQTWSDNKGLRKIQEILKPFLVQKFWWEPKNSYKLKIHMLLDN